jgi:hypothetical protein
VEKQMNLEELKEMEYLKCVGLLAELIDLDADAKEKIHKNFQNIGIKNFFLHLESVDLPTEVSDKLKSIKAIIEIVDVKRGRA